MLIFEISLLLALSVSLSCAQASFPRTGKITTYWDCCKPSCGWPGRADVAHPVTICAKDGKSLLSDQNTQSGCQNGDAFVCSSQQPFALNRTFAYGFAAANIAGLNVSDTCCACYEITFTNGPATRQKIVVQVTNTGADLKANHFDLQIPGGGFGLFNGCRPQWRAPLSGWGAQYGGFSTLQECGQLPVPLRDGCRFRFIWLKNVKDPGMRFGPVPCPTELTTRSGCTRNA